MWLGSGGFIIRKSYSEKRSRGRSAHSVESVELGVRECAVLDDCKGAMGHREGITKRNNSARKMGMERDSRDEGKGLLLTIIFDLI